MNYKTVIKRKLDADERMLEDFNFNEIFLGSCMGIGLSHRGPNDPHVCFTILVEDDGIWHVKSGEYISSFWMQDLTDVLNEVQIWLDQNENVISDNVGSWEFKNETPLNKD